MNGWRELAVHQDAAVAILNHSHSDDFWLHTHTLGRGVDPIDKRQTESIKRIAFSRLCDELLL
jgi:phage-related protein